MKYDFIKGKSAKRVVLIRAYNGMLTQARMLQESSYTPEEKLESLNTIMNLKYYLEHYDELEPVIKEFAAKKAIQDKYNDKEDYENFRI